MSRKVLIVDDDRATRHLLCVWLNEENFETHAVSSAAEALSTLHAQDFDVVVTDMNMPGMTGLELCAKVATFRPDIPVVVITAFGSMETAIAAIRAGAYDFITKPFEVDAVLVALQRAIVHHELREEVKRLRSMAARPSGFDDLVGASPAMTNIYPLLERVADCDATVLITGESGTGKELIARALHNQSARAAEPFIAVNCAAMPENLLESELFGHVRGAFTDAKSARSGLLLQANRGTIFLDEIGDMPLSLQPKLLRALEERKIRPLGGDEQVAFDVRIIVATNRDLETMIEEGRFREDLYYRINVITIGLPPLRARASDALLLAQHFIEHFAREAGRPVLGISRDVARRFQEYPWPGNVRELRNCIERAVALTHLDQIALGDLPERIRDYTPPSVRTSPAHQAGTLEDVERRYILEVLRSADGNKSLAAERLGLSRKTLYRKLAQYGVTSTDSGEHARQR